MRPPEPKGSLIYGHLNRWLNLPLELIEEGATLGSVFGLRLWQRGVVGYTPEWNRLVLGDLDIFRSKGSLSAIVPYLAGGVVLTDTPFHKPRREELNPHFHAGALENLRIRVQSVIKEHLPRSQFEAKAWASEVVRSALNAAFFTNEFPAKLLATYLAPLDRPMPWPLIPRPKIFKQMDISIAQMLDRPDTNDLTTQLRLLDNIVEEIRIALAAAYDTTAHTLAWALWHLAEEPKWRTSDGIRLIIKETLRLYPAGWIGSRRASQAFSFGPYTFPKGTIVFYAPYLTHRFTELWPDPLIFNPERFTSKVPAWGYIPFSGGERTCLGMHLAQLILEEALTPFLEGDLQPISGDPSPQSGLTLTPKEPLWLLWSISSSN